MIVYIMFTVGMIKVVVDMFVKKRIERYVSFDIPVTQLIILQFEHYAG